MEMETDQEEVNRHLKVYYQLWPDTDWKKVLEGGGAALDPTSISSYFQAHPELVPELILEEDVKNLELFLSLNIPLTKLFVNNCKSGVTFYDRWKTELKLLLEKTGESIKHLELDQINLWATGNEKEFFKGVPNLEVLIAKTILRPPMEDLRKIWENGGKAQTAPCPELYKNVKILDIGMEKNWKIEVSKPKHERTLIVFLYEMGFQTVLTHSFPALEEVSFPFVIDTKQSFITYQEEDGVPQPVTEKAIFFGLQTITDAIWARNRNQAGKNRDKLRKISFKNCYYNDPLSENARNADGAASKSFFILAKLCYAVGILLEKVNANWFMVARHKKFERAENCIVSMVNIHPCVVEKLQLEKLDSLEVFTSRSCVVVTETKAGYQVTPRPSWNLKNLSVIVDSDTLDGQAGELQADARHRTSVYTMFRGDKLVGSLPKDLLHPYSDQSICCLFTYLFSKCCPFCPCGYPKLTELKICVKEDIDWKPVRKTAEMIVWSCPNVTKLELTNWTGKNKWLMEMWIGMVHLEEVKLVNCKELKNEAFIGLEEDIENPVFTRLKKLKKVSLIGLDKTPKVTDTLFRLVLSQMQLTHLVLTSEKPLEKVTESGIRELLGGPFAQSCVMFPFIGWSLKDCTGPAWERLQNEFKLARV